MNLLARKRKNKTPILCESVFCIEKELVSCLFLVSNYLLALVVATSLTNAESKVVLAALRALNKVGGSFKLPNAGASLHFSRVRNFSLWYCHCDYLLCESASTQSRTMLFIIIIHLIEQFL